MLKLRKGISLAPPSFNQSIKANDITSIHNLLEGLKDDKDHNEFHNLVDRKYKKSATIKSTSLDQNKSFLRLNSTRGLQEDQNFMLEQPEYPIRNQMTKNKSSTYQGYQDPEQLGKYKH